MFWSIILCMIPILVIVGGVYLIYALDFDEGGAVLIVFGCIGCLVIFLTMFFGRIGAKASVDRYKAMQTTLDSQRKNNAQIENATITLEIVRMNKWLATAKYKGKIISFWYPKEIYDIKPIE